MPDTVLLALHYQNENCHRDGKIKVGIAADADWREARLAAAARLFAGARAKAVPIVHVRLAVRPDYADVAPNTALSRQWIALGAWREGSWGVEFIAGLEPRADEIVITHNRNSAFHGSMLGPSLAALAPRRLVIAGVSTTYAVESTVREATDIGHAVWLAHDACSSGTQDQHRASLAALRRLAEVEDVATIVGYFANGFAIPTRAE